MAWKGEVRGGHRKESQSLTPLPCALEERVERACTALMYSRPEIHARLGPEIEGINGSEYALLVDR